MACGCCNRKAELLKALRGFQYDKELAESRASVCDKCDYLEKDLFCRAEGAYIPKKLRDPEQTCYYGFWINK